MLAELTPEVLNKLPVGNAARAGVSTCTTQHTPMQCKLQPLEYLDTSGAHIFLTDANLHRHTLKAAPAIGHMHRPNHSTKRRFE